MPDHIHLFCAPLRPEISLDMWVRYWKSLVSRAWPGPEQHPIWQRHFWDTQLRQGESYYEKWFYVRENPVRRGLVSDSTVWPYAGELHDLAWN
jgi:REP element-mobilizing transposase RayT